MIELLVVVAIIGILAAVLMPALSRARDVARTSLCSGNLRQMGMAMMVYAGDHGGTLAYDTHLTSWSLTNHGYGLPTTTGRLRDYLEDRTVYFDARPGQLPTGPSGVMYCPAFSLELDVRGRYPFPGWEGKYQTNFQNMGPTYIARSYRINDWFAVIPAYNADGTQHNWNQSGDDKKLPRTSQIRRPTMLILFGEAYNKNLFTGFGGLYFNPRHGDRAPVVRADGSIKLFTSAEAVGGTGYMWQPNHGVHSSFPVDTWGTYLHPDYNRPY